MWRVYKHTGYDTDYEVYKEALKPATNEVRHSKRNYEHKLEQNTKSDSKSFYAYVRSKQIVRDKVGPLEDSVGNIITQGFLMAVELNLHFSSVFTREDTSSLPVPETKFKNGSRNKSVNYRPVSLTSVICKLLESFIRDHMMNFLIKHKLINPSQHGFLKARSCLTIFFFFLGNNQVG